MSVSKTGFYLFPNNKENRSIAESIVLVYFQFYVMIQIADVVREDTYPPIILQPEIKIIEVSSSHFLGWYSIAYCSGRC